MNKTVKRILSLCFASFSISFINNNSSFEFGTRAVYASSDSLESLSLDGANLYENSNYTKELDDSKNLKKTYYAKLSSDESKVSVEADGYDDSKYIVKITKSRSKKTYDLNDDIIILSGKTTLYVSLYDKDSYDSDKSNSVKKQYKIQIRKYSKEEEKAMENDDEGDVYLKNLQLDYGNIPIGFRRDKTEYNVDVDKDTKSLAIYAEPEDGADEVRINNLLVDEDDDYKKKINLSEGTTRVEIELSYNDDKRVYVINVTRKDKTENNNENNADAQDINNLNNKVEDTEVKNQNIDTDKNLENTNKPGWVKVNNDWKYNDDYGNALKDTWFFDKSYNKKYYFNKLGIMQTGWINPDQSWYYLNESGAMETGWKLINNKWYYLDYDGKMKTGWFKDIDGKYYYLDSSGAMLKDIKVDGYTLGSDGAWKK